MLKALPIRGEHFFEIYLIALYIYIYIYIRQGKCSSIVYFVALCKSALHIYLFY